MPRALSECTNAPNPSEKPQEQPQSPDNHHHHFHYNNKFFQTLPGKKSDDPCQTPRSSANTGNTGKNHQQIRFMGIPRLIWRSRGEEQSQRPRRNRRRRLPFRSRDLQFQLEAHRERERRERREGEKRMAKWEKRERRRAREENAERDGGNLYRLCSSFLIV
ncbi:hypothetical protein L484_009038 [Morus notabilis]|uniref:Uncharacterized protein n=1 Tax=Morus notabilis TaxID=981085 RepID=W9RLG7_9ROSA|nr:hypothetical protein L484_009038 [Morus notabilis]